MLANTMAFGKRHQERGLQGPQVSSKEAKARQRAIDALPPIATRATIEATPKKHLEIPAGSDQQTIARYAELASQNPARIGQGQSLSELYADVYPRHGRLSRVYSFPMLWPKEGTKVNGIVRD